MARSSFGIAFIFLLSVFTTRVRAQIGDGGFSTLLKKKVHLADPDKQNKPTALQVSCIVNNA